MDVELFSKKLMDQMRQSIQEWSRYILWKTAFKKLEGIWSP